MFAALAASALVLTCTSAGYGYHRDELYFRMLRPGWGYVDQPPLTPLLARATQLVADQPWAMRLPATVAAVLSTFVLVLVTRELGGGRGAQGLCAWGYAFASFPLVMGHVLLTSSVDLPVWPAVLLFVLRAQLRGDPRWWLAAGLVVGVGMYNKLLVAVLLISLAAGVLLVGPRGLLRSRWVLAGAAVAVAVGFPNLVYQVSHGWPQLSMGRALAAKNAAGVRVSMWPFLALLLGPPLVPIWVAGAVALLRRPQWRPVRFIAAAVPVLLLLVFAMGSQNYYPLGLVSVLYAAGCVPASNWAASRVRTGLLVTAVGLNAAVSLTLGLPLIPVGAVGATPVPGVNQVAADSVGWPVYADQVARVYATLSPAQQRRAVIVASNYGEAGAIDRYGPPHQLPAVVSGHNQLFFQTHPPTTADIAIFVGGQLSTARGDFRSCLVRARLDNGVHVDNEEQGQPVAVCRHPIGGWSRVWPLLRHED